MLVHGKQRVLVADIQRADKYRLQVVDAEYYKQTIPCQVACPVKTDARGYVIAVARGEFERGYQMAREPNPLASTCGLVCNAPCEDACRRGKIDRPIAIRQLKRFLTNAYGVEAKSPAALGTNPDRKGPTGQDLLGPVGPGNSETASGFSNLRSHAAAVSDPSGELPGLGRKVALVGSGPASLVCAHDLAILGYKPTVYDAENEPGGQLVVGVQDWRLPREMVAAEIEDIRSLGVEFVQNTYIGRDIKFRELWSMGYEAIFLAIGFMTSRMLQLEGSDGPGVVGSVEIIQKVCRGEKVELPKNVVVVGGGAVATDGARLAIRYGAETCSMVALESFEEMPAPAIEIEESLEENIAIHNRWGPDKIIRDESNNITAMQFKKVTSVFDEAGRFNPQFDEDHERLIIPCEMVIFAVGQGSDLEFLDEEDGVEQSRPGVLAIDPATFATTAPGVFAGGDIAVGPNIIITCVEHGHVAARSIHQYLSGKKLELVTRAELTIVDPKDYLFPHYINTPRQSPEFVEPEARLTPDRPVPEMSFTKEEAMAEGQRCLQCHIQTVFDGDLCVMCNGCVDACPTYCLKMVNVGEIDGDSNLHKVVEDLYGVPLKRFQDAPEDDPILQLGTIMLKDEDRCIRCGLCAEICPTGAVTMEALNFEEKWVSAQ